MKCTCVEFSLRLLLHNCDAGIFPFRYIFSFSGSQECHNHTSCLAITEMKNAPTDTSTIFQSWKTATSKQTYIPGISCIIIHLHTCPNVCGARHSWSSKTRVHPGVFFQTTSDHCSLFGHQVK